MKYQERMLAAQNRILVLLRERCKESWVENRREISNIELEAESGLYPDDPLRKARLHGENNGYVQVAAWIDSLLSRGKKK